MLKIQMYSGISHALPVTANHETKTNSRDIRTTLVNTRRVPETGPWSQSVKNCVQVSFLRLYPKMQSYVST